MSHINTKGRSSPLGATVYEDGVNFSVFSRNATGVELLFFDHEDNDKPVRSIQIDPWAGRTYHYWHVFVSGVQAGQLYGYRVRGPHEPARGMRFDPSKVLLDPYGRGVAVPRNYSREAASKAGDNAAVAMKSVVVDTHKYNWEGDTSIKRPSSRTIIYEMHVRGFTCHPSSGVSEKARGTYAGLIEKIPYLQELGVTAVELLPVFQFDAQDCPPGLVNYWAMRRYLSFPRIRRTARGRIRLVRQMNSVIWSRHCIGQTLRLFSMSCSIIPPKAASPGQR